MRSSLARRRARAGFVGALVAGLLAAAFALPANAEFVERMTLTRKIGKVSKTYEAPHNPRPFGIGVWNYDECRTGTHCHIIPITFDHQGHLNNAVTSWRLAYRDADQREFQANFYEIDPEEEEEANNETELTGLVEVESSKDGTYKVLGSDHIDLEAGEYAIAVYCGGCEGTFELSGTFTKGSTYTPPARYTPPPFTPQPQEDDEEDEGSTTGSGPSLPPAEPVASPGENGPVRTTSVAGLAAAQQAEPPSTRGVTITNIVMLTLLGLVVSIGGTMVAMKIRRDLKLKA